MDNKLVVAVGAQKEELDWDDLLSIAESNVKEKDKNEHIEYVPITKKINFDVKEIKKDNSYEFPKSVLIDENISTNELVLEGIKHEQIFAEHQGSALIDETQYLEKLEGVSSNMVQHYGKCAIKNDSVLRETLEGISNKVSIHSYDYDIHGIDNKEAELKRESNLNNLRTTQNNLIQKKTNVQNPESFINRRQGLIPHHHNIQNINYENNLNITNPVLDYELRSLFSKTDSIENSYKSIEEKRLEKYRSFCRNKIYPIFQEIKQKLSFHEREANIHLDLELLKVSIEVRYMGRIEFDYTIHIKNYLKEPSLSVNVRNLQGEHIIKPNLNTLNIDRVTGDDIFKDFLESYKECLYRYSR